MTVRSLARPTKGPTLYLLLALAGMGTLLTLVATAKYGAGCWPDCVAYVSVARNLLAGEGYLMYAGRPLLDFPPLFSTLLAVIGLTGLDPFVSARFVNALAFGLVIGLAGLWLHRHVKSTALVLIGSLAVLFSTPLLGVSVMAISEPVFLALILLSLLAMEWYLISDKLVPLVVAASLASLAFLTRYIGITVVLTGLVLVLARRKTRVTDRLVRVGILGAIGAAPMAVWLARNYLVSSTLTGGREPSAYTLGQVVYHALDTATAWFLPPSSLLERNLFATLPGNLQGLLRYLTLPPATRIAVGLLLVLSLAAAFVLAIRGRSDRPDSVDWGLVAPMLCFLVFYVVALVVSLANVHVHENPPVDNRFLSPAFVPLVLLLLLMLDRVLHFWQERAPQAVSRGLVVACGMVLLAYPFLFGGVSTLKRIRDGAGGYSQDDFQESSLIAYLRENPSDGQYFSNYADLVYHLAGLPVQFSPRSAADARAIEDALVREGGTSYLVWFDDSPWAWGLLDFEAVDEHLELALVESVSDGSIYLINSRSLTVLPGN